MVSFRSRPLRLTLLCGTTMHGLSVRARTSAMLLGEKSPSTATTLPGATCRRSMSARQCATRAAMSPQLKRRPSQTMASASGCELSRSTRKSINIDVPIVLEAGRRVRKTNSKSGQKNAPPFLESAFFQGGRKANRDRSRDQIADVFQIKIHFSPIYPQGLDQGVQGHLAGLVEDEQVDGLEPEAVLGLVSPDLLGYGRVDELR